MGCSFTELYKLDISPYTEDMSYSGLKLTYLNWAKCIELLYENGAKSVQYGNEHNIEGHPLFLSPVPLGAPYVRVWVEVDGVRREIDYPVIAGSKSVSTESLTQDAIQRASQRAFVKCVAVNWGLGLSLWQKEEQANERAASRNNYSDQAPWKCRKYVEQMMTAIQKGKGNDSGMNFNDVLVELDMSEKEFTRMMNGFEALDKFFVGVKQLYDKRQK